MDCAPNPIADWLRYCRRYYTTQTYRHYRYIVNCAASFFEKNLHCVTTSEIELYLDHLLQTHTARSVNSYLTVLKSFFRWLEGPNNRVNKIKMLRMQPPHQRCLTPKEYEASLAVAKEGIERSTLQILANTGIRRFEFVALRPSSVDREMRYIVVLGKGQKQRLVPVNQVVRQILLAHPNCDFIRPFQSRELALNQFCARIAKLAGIPRFGPHALRHFFATRLAAAGISLLILSKILGHADTQTTEKIYCHLLPSDVLGATDCLQL